MEDTLKELLEILKNISPEIWAILIKQVYIEVLGKVLWGIVCAIGSYALVKRLRPKLEGNLKWFAIATGILLAMISFGLFLSALKWIVHPEFYALRFLLWQLR